MQDLLQPSGTMFQVVPPLMSLHFFLSLVGITYIQVSWNAAGDIEIFKHMGYTHQR